jgi:hypothetical membrane protein
MTKSLPTQAQSVGSDVNHVERPNLSDDQCRGHHRAIAGALFSIAGIGMVMSIITGAAVYPRSYTTFGNTISDLSGTEPPHSIMLQPSRTLFIVTMLLAGALILVGDWFLARSTDRRRLVVTMAVFGVGLVGIGIFPGNVEGWHPLFAMACFLGGSMAAIMSRKVVDGAFRYFAAALGATALVATIFGLESLENWGPQDALGRGGIERWIAYPVLLWLVGFGAHLMSAQGRSRARD